jgi:dTDP-4-dehydrorhamnose 3,5-epimerase
MINKIETTSIPGLLKIFTKSIKDQRGAFVKIFHEKIFSDNNIDTYFAEEYFSVSRKGVLRGIHFQLPPFDHYKLIYCSNGTFLDVAVDLRKGSPTFGCFELFEINAEDSLMLYLPKGIGHGFYSISDNTIINYKVSTVYSPTHDSGILWNSLPIPWPDSTPILSDRDKSFQTFNHFESPFEFKEM